MKVPHHLQKIQGKEAQAMTQWQIDRMPTMDQIRKSTESWLKLLRLAEKQSKTTEKPSKQEKRNSTQMSLQKGIK